MFAHGTALEPTTSLVTVNLIEEIHHRVVNEYSEAISSLSLAALRAGDDKTRAELAKAAERLRDHAASHCALMPPPVGDTTNLAVHIGRICKAFTKATLEERGVLLTLDTIDVVLPAERCWRIGLVVAELIRNAARHGLHGKEGRISVQFVELAGLLTCLVGNTSRPPVDMKPGRGLRLIRSLVADLGGSVEWSFTSDGNFALVQLGPINRITDEID
jgi:two-component sensor histidine kinase